MKLKAKIDEQKTVTRDGYTTNYMDAQIADEQVPVTINFEDGRQIGFADNFTYEDNGDITCTVHIDENEVETVNGIEDHLTLAPKFIGETEMDETGEYVKQVNVQQITEVAFVHNHAIQNFDSEVEKIDEEENNSE